MTADFTLPPMPNLDGYNAMKDEANRQIAEAFAIPPSALKPPLTIQRLIEAFETLDALASLIAASSAESDRP